MRAFRQAIVCVSLSLWFVSAGLGRELPTTVPEQVGLSSKWNGLETMQCVVEMAQVFVHCFQRRPRK